MVLDVGLPSLDGIEICRTLRGENDWTPVLFVTARDDAPVSLTATEFDLLAKLMSSPGRVFTREQLLSSVWGQADYGGGRTVDVHVAQVRSKLGDACPIVTRRGVGYTAEEPRE